MKLWRGGTYSLLLLDGGGQEDNGSMHGANHHWRCVKSSSPWKVQSPEARVQRNQRPKSRVQRRESRESSFYRDQSSDQSCASYVISLSFYYQFIIISICGLCHMQPVKTKRACSHPPHQTKILGGFHMELFVWGHQTQGRQEGRSCETVCVRTSNLRATGGYVCISPPSPLARPAYR